MKELYTKLAKVQGLAVTKDGKGHQHKYPTLDNIIDTLKPLLDDHNLLLFHASNNGAMETHLVDVDTQQEIVSSFVLPQLADMQKMGGAVTYAKRYNLGQIFNIVTDKDDDGEAVNALIKTTYVSPSRSSKGTF